MWEVEDLSQESLYELSQSQSQGQDSSTDQVLYDYNGQQLSPEPIILKLASVQTLVLTINWVRKKVLAEN